MNQSLVTAETMTQEAPSIFGLRYLEEDEANILDVVGCQSVLGDDEVGVSGTLRFCGDWDTDLAE